MNTRISHLLAWAHPHTAKPAVWGRALRGCRPCGLVPAAPPLLSLARAVRHYRTVLLFVLGLVFSWHTALSQSFPVSALVQVNNFSPQLEAYDDPGRVVITLISTDERPEYEALLRISLSGPGFNVRTREDFMPFPILLRRNQPLVLTGAQLRDYFDPLNLNFQGESLENYLASGGLLSEGPVSLCVEVYDFNRFFDPPVSNTGCATGFMLLHRPPILTEPGTEVEPSFPQQLRFQWQPQHAGVAVRYTLEVYEDLLPGMGDNLIIDATQPLLLKTTTAPFYTMTSLDPLLQMGARYLVRIRAEDITGRAAFLNDGWSDIYSFIYLSNDDPPSDCPQPANFTGTALDPYSAELAWQPDPTVASWLLTSLNGDSIPLTDTAQAYTFTGLLPDQTYTYQLCAICTDGTNACLTTSVVLPADTTSGPCGPALTLDNWPLNDSHLLLSWNDIPSAQGFRLRWGILPPNSPSTPVPPAPNRTERQSPQQSPQPRGRNRNRNRGLTPAPAAPVQAAPISTISAPVFAYTDSLHLPAGSIDSEIGLLEMGNTCQIELCKVCPDGSLECVTTTVAFNGLDDDCLTSLNITRTDSTDTSLTLNWASTTNDYSADSTFLLIWQLSDGSAPADTATLFYPSGTFTIDSLEAFRAYDLRICAACTAGQPACRELEPFGGCPAAYEPYLADLDLNNALIAWDTIPGDSLLPTNARYKARVAFRWDSLDVGRNTYFTPSNYDLIAALTAEISGLSQSITYLAQIQTQCADSIWSDWSVPVRFNTDCAVSDSLWLNELTDSSALVAALAYSNAAYYEFEYRRTDQTAWTRVSNLPTALLSLSGLRAETEYEVRLRYWCTQGVWSDYTASFFFTTLPPCEPPFRITVDPILAAAAQFNWDNYINATQVELRYRPKIGGYYYFSMFPPPWQTAVVPDSVLYLNDLQGGAAYEYQLRSDCAVNFSEWTAIDEFALLCAPPELITVTDSTYESAIVQLSGLPPSTQSSSIEYRRLGDSSWLSRTASYGFASLPNLDDMTYYELRATATCSSGQTSAYSDTVQFRTPVKCLVPESLVASDLQPFSAQLDWDITGTIDEWEIRVYGPMGSTIPAVEAPQQAVPLQMGTEGARTSPQSPDSPSPPANTQPQGQRPSNRGGSVRPGGNPLSTGGPITTAPVTTAPLGANVGQVSAPPPYSDWHSFFVTNPTKLLDELRQNTEYLVVVRARCPEFGWTDYSDTLSFRTLTDCRVPVNLVANEILQTTTRTNWTAVNPYAEEYLVQLESLSPLTAINFQAAPVESIPQGGGRVPQLPTGGGETPGGQTPRIPSGGGDALTALPAEELTNWFTAIYQDSILTPELTAVFTGLRPNTEYRFRVKSRCDNFGWTDYSDWLIFRTDHCAAPVAIVEEAIDRSTMNISWTPSNGINDYEFKYKLADDPGADWITIMTQDYFVELNSLLTNQIYDYQVTEVCQGGAGLRAALQDTFIMERPSLNNGFYVCGVEGQVDLSNQVPLATLVPGDTIIAFDFPIIITLASGGGGYFSGMGDIRMPYFNKAKFSFEFDNIFVNDEYRMVGGYLEATGFGVEVLPPWADSLLSDVLDLLELADSVLQAEEIGILEDLMALGENANLPPDLQQGIQDVLDCFEQATTQAQIDSCNVLLDSVLVEVNEFLDQLYEGDFQVVFQEDQNQQFGFDAKGAQEPESWYDKRTLAAADYYVAYKSVKENSPELVDGVVMPPGAIDSVAFSQPSGVPLPVSIDGDTATITFVGQAGDDYFLVAEQITNDSTPNHIAGLLNVVPYPELPLKIALVPLSSSAGGGVNAPSAQQGLLEILGQAVVKPTVTMEAPFTVPGYDGTLDAVGSGLLTNYSIEMRDIINAFENRPAGIDPDTYYLFLTDSYESTSRAGFMPRGRQFGFIYMGNAGTAAALNRTIAHEIAHGAYVLKHTFDEYSSELPEGSTDNLMDYVTGTHLYKWQWDLIHDPVNAPLLPGDEGGEMVIVEDMTPFEDFKNGDGSYTFLSPGGKPITIPAATTMVIFNSGDELPREHCNTKFKIYPLGTLKAFRAPINDTSRLFVSCVSCSAENFIGYTRSGPGDNCGPAYIDSLTRKNTITSAIIGFPCFYSGQIVFKTGETPISVNSSEVSANNYTSGGSIQVFDWLANKYNNISTAKVIYTPNFRPQLDGQLLIKFLSRVQGYASCGNRSAIHVFTHLHQLNKNPDFYAACGNDLLDDVDADAVAIFNRLRRNYRMASARDEFGIPNFNLPQPSFGSAEIAAWQNADMSIYEAMDVLQDSMWSQSYWDRLDENSTADARKLLDDFYEFRDQECVFRNLTINQRLKALKLLNRLPLTESNFFDFKFTPLVFLGGLPMTISPYSEDDEEHLYNAILGTTPTDATQYQQILDFYKGSDGSYTEFFSVANKMLETLDDEGYARFATILTQMVIGANGNPSYNITPANPADIDPGLFPKNLFCDIGGQNDPNEAMYVKSFVVNSSYYREDFEASFDNNKINLSSAYTYSQFTSEWSMETITAEEYTITGNPFDFVAIRIESGLKIAGFEGAAYNPETGILIIPYCWAHLLYNKIDDEEVKLGIRLALDFLSVALVPFSGGASLGLRILAVADAIYGAVDVAFAVDMYELGTTGESNFAPEVHGIWNAGGIVLGAANLTGLISIAGVNRVRRIRLQNLHDTYQSLKQNPLYTTSDLSELLTKVRQTVDEIVDAPLPSNLTQAELDEINRFKFNARRELDALEYYSRYIIKPLPSGAPNTSTVDFAFTNNSRTGGYTMVYRADGVERPVGTVTQDADLILSPQNWLTSGNASTSVVEVGTINSVRYVDQATGQPVNGALSVLYDGVTNLVYVRTAIVDILTEFPDLNMFKVVFDAKTWTWGNFSLDFAQYANSLNQANKVALRDIFTTWATGNSGLQKFDAFRDQILDNTTGLQTYLNLDMSKVGSWELFYDAGALASVRNDKLGRLGTDLVNHLEAEPWLRADLNNRFKAWLNVNNPALDNTTTQLGEWLEDMVLLNPSCDLIPHPSVQYTYQIRYNGEVIAEASPSNITYTSAGPLQNGQSVVARSPDGSFGVVCNPCRIGLGACFPAGTPVHTTEGLRAIEDIQPGDEVISYDENTGDCAVAKVKVAMRKQWHRFTRIFTSSDTITASDNHPFYIQELKRYLPADSIRAGMKVLTLAGALLTVSDAYSFDTTMQVFNIDIEHYDNYYVGETGILVHNDGPRCWPFGITEAMLDGWTQAQKDKLWNHLNSGNFGQFVNLIENNPAPLPGKLQAWKIIEEAGDDATKARFMFTNSGNPKYLLTNGQQILAGELELTLTFTHLNQSVTEPFLIIKQSGKYYFRPKYFLEQGTQSRSRNVSRTLIPARPLPSNPATVNTNDIRSMQSSISNHTGETETDFFFALKNAYQFKIGELDVNSFSPIRVWRNLDDGEVWTLDHRRLVACRLAGLGQIPVEWVDPQVVVGQSWQLNRPSKYGESWKMSTTTAGIDLDVFVFVKNSNGKFVFADNRYSPAYTNAERTRQTWSVEEASGGNYILKDNNGNLVDIQTGIPNYIDWNAESIVGAGGSFDLVKQTENLLSSTPSKATEIANYLSTLSASEIAIFNAAASASDNALIASWRTLFLEAEPATLTIANNLDNIQGLAAQLVNHPAKLPDFETAYQAADAAGRAKLLEEVAWFFGFKPGHSKESIAAIAKGSRPTNPGNYLLASYISEHSTKFSSEGGGLVVIKGWLEGGSFDSWPPGKYAGLKSEMDAVIADFQATGDLRELERKLGFSANDLQATDEIFYFRIPATNPHGITFTMPTGNEIGANTHWLAGGKTSGNVTEATMNGSENIQHNKDITVLQGLLPDNVQIQ